MEASVQRLPVFERATRLEDLLTLSVEEAGATAFEMFSLGILTQEQLEEAHGLIARMQNMSERLLKLLA
jgi:hypothetical protein